MQSFDFHKPVCYLSVVTTIIVLHLCRSVCTVDGTENTFFGTSFPPSIVFNIQVPNFSELIWLIGTATINRTGKNEGNKSSLTLSWNRIFENYDCEMKLPDGNKSLRQFPMKVFNSCVLPDNEDLTAFKEGKKSAVVILSGKANVSKSYLFKMQNQTLQIYFEQGTDRQLQLIDVQCNVSLKDNDLDPYKIIYKEKIIGDISSGAGTIVTSVLFGVAAIIGAICIASWCVLKRRRAAKASKKDVRVDAAVPLANGSVHQMLL